MKKRHPTKVSPTKTSSPLEKAVLRSMRTYQYKSDKIAMPNWMQYQKELIDLVNDNWDLPLLGKSCTYNSSDRHEDLFTEEDIKDRILHIQQEDKEIKSSYQDKKKITAITTEFNTRHFFADLETRKRFLYLVTNSFRIVFGEIYKKEDLNRENLNFILKGGVVFRLFIKELLRGFVKEVEDYIIDNIGEHIELSDFDFEIMSKLSVITPTIYNKINIIGYLTILKIRNYLEEFEILDFLQLRTGSQVNKLRTLHAKIQKKCQNMPASNHYHNIRVDRVEIAGEIASYDLPENRKRDSYSSRGGSKGRYDFAVIVDKSSSSVDRKEIVLIQAAELFEVYGMDQKYIDLAFTKGQPMYASHNPLIVINQTGTDQADLSIRFQLNRIKYNYVLFYKKRVTVDGVEEDLFFKENIPGEILDFSHADLTDRKKVKFQVDFSQNLYLKECYFYEFNLRFMTYSHYGLISDLLEIIFTESNYQPWTTSKDTKRLFRLIYIVVLSYFSMPLVANSIFSLPLWTISKGIVDANIYHRKMAVLKKLLQRIKQTPTLKLSPDEVDEVYSSVKDTFKDDILRDVYKCYFYASVHWSNPQYQTFLRRSVSLLEKLLILVKINYRTSSQMLLLDNPLSSSALAGGAKKIEPKIGIIR
jgi:hypothetical protein